MDTLSYGQLRMITHCAQAKIWYDKKFKRKDIPITFKTCFSALKTFGPPTVANSIRANITVFSSNFRRNYYRLNELSELIDKKKHKEHYKRSCLRMAKVLFILLKRETFITYEKYKRLTPVIVKAVQWFPGKRIPYVEERKRKDGTPYALTNVGPRLPAKLLLKEGDWLIIKCNQWKEKLSDEKFKKQYVKEEK